MIGVIDYGMGNLYSVSKALERVGVPYFVSEKPEELKEADAFILPGVGSFGDAMDNLGYTKLAWRNRNGLGLEYRLARWRQA